MASNAPSSSTTKWSGKVIKDQSLMELHLRKLHLSYPFSQWFIGELIQPIATRGRQSMHGLSRVDTRNGSLI